MAGRVSEPFYDVLVAEAAAALAVPVAFLSFVNGAEEQVAAIRGWQVTAIDAERSFAPRMRGERDVVVISDTTADARFASHPLVTGLPNIRFYAAAPVFDGHGDFAGALSILDRKPRTLTTEQVTLLRVLGRQVSRELAAKERVEEANDRFREFFEQTDDLVMSISADGRLLHANEAVMQTLGFSREELSRTPLLQVVDPDSRDEFRDAFADTFATGEPQRVETVFITASGRRITVDGSLHPKMLDGHAVLARVIFRDVSDRKQFESELGNARDAALEAARLKTQFLTNVSHEIRTPMNGIVGMLDLLLSTPVNQEQMEFAHQARASAEQLLSIVNNILYVSNLEAGGVAAANVDFDLFRTLQRLVEVMKVAALGKEVEVSLVYDKQLPPIFRGNQSKLRQVVANLLDNAVKFTEQGSVTLSVATQTETDTHRVIRFEIRDTGIGIADEDRLLLFEKFSQVEATSTRRFGGIGLGLATARQLVETMGGLMDVDSTPGVGSTFWFTVPFPKQISAARRPIVSSDLDFRGKRVLLVDSSQTSRRIVRHYLETTWEMRVETCDTAVTALAALRNAAGRDPIRIVVFDRMPDLSPLDFAREVRQDPQIGGTSLVYLLGTTSDVNAERLREAGINAATPKPVGQGELFDAITIALAHDAIPLARTAEQPLDSRALPPPVTDADRKSIRVLLAEDNFLNMKLTMSQLHKLGYIADSVSNGKEALEALEKMPYAVVLMDCQMPILDGYEATMEIRKRERAGGPRPRIIAMTANALEGDREKCLAAGMDDYLAKPTKADELEVALARTFVAMRAVK